MKELSTFLQISIYITIALVLFTLCVNFISALGVFQTTLETGISTTGSSDNIFSQITGLSGGMEYVWSIILTLTGLAAVVVAVFTRQVTPIGIYLFSAVFWTSYNRCISVINVPIGDGTMLFSTMPMSMFLVIATVGILFLWAAAIIGVLTGSA